MNKSKIIYLVIPILLGIILLCGFMFFVFGHIDWEDYYEKQLKNDIRTINFPGGYYHLYQERYSPDDPWTTYLDMCTNFQTKNDVFSYIEYQMEELNKSFSDPEFEDNFLEVYWLGFREVLPIDQLKEFLETFVSKENAYFSVVYSDQVPNQSLVEEVYSNWEQYPQGFDVNDLHKTNYTIKGILGLTSVLTTEAGKLLINDPRILLIETLQGKEIRLLIEKFNLQIVTRVSGPFWQEYVKWVFL